jgi:multiple sugar transport system substrate-binding protein
MKRRMSLDRWNVRRVTRRDVLRLGGAAALGVTTGPFIWTSAKGQTFDWKRFRGKELFVMFIEHPWAEEMVKWLPEFQDLTGMKVSYEMLPGQQKTQKMVVQFTAGDAGIDAFFSSLYVEKKRFWKAGWYEPLNPFLQNRSLTAPDFDWNDFTEGARTTATQPDGTISAIPCFMDALILFYRKDIFQKNGLKPPRTMAEMEEIAKELHNPPQLYGIVYRGFKNANAATWDGMLFNFGGDFLTKDGKANLTSKEATTTTEYYARLLRNYGPPGVVLFNWYECSSAFSQGQVAMYYDAANFANILEDKDKAKTAGKVGYVIFPGGPAGQWAATFTPGMAISRLSKNKEAAWYFVQWSTNKKNFTRELVAGVGVARVSAWNAPEVQAQWKYPQDWYDAYLASLKVGRLGMPEILGVTEYRDIIGVAIEKAIEGADARTVLSQAQKEFQELLDKTEKA